MPEEPPAGTRPGPDDAELSKPSTAGEPPPSPAAPYPPAADPWHEASRQPPAGPDPGTMPPAGPHPGTMPPAGSASAEPPPAPGETTTPPPAAGETTTAPPAAGETTTPPYAWSPPGSQPPPAGWPVPPVGGPVPPGGAPPPYPWAQPGGPLPPAAGPVPPPGTPTPPIPPYPWQVAPTPAARPRRRNRMVFVTSGLLLALLALLVVPLVVNRGDNGSPSAGGGGGGSADSGTDGGEASTPPPATSPEQYQRALTSTDGALAASWRKLSQARTPATVRNAADALALAAESEAEKLRQMVPPDQVAVAHDQLVTALEDFSAQLSASSTENVCAGSSAAPRLSREGALDQVRTAAQAMRAADPAHAYRVGTWVPKAGTEPKRRLTNGKYLKRAVTGGSGQLKIKNGGSADAVVSIVVGKSKHPAIVVYVRAKQNFTVRGVRDGSYHIFLTNGTDWDSRAKTFSRDCSFERFDDTFKFKTTSTTFTIWEVTVQAVSGGNATASSVSPDDFPIS